MFHADRSGRICLFSGSLCDTVISRTTQTVYAVEGVDSDPCNRVKLETV